MSLVSQNTLFCSIHNILFKEIKCLYSLYIYILYSKIIIKLNNVFMIINIFIYDANEKEKTKKK